MVIKRRIQRKWLRKEQQKHITLKFINLWERDFKKAQEELYKDVKKFIKNDRGWGSRKRIEEYKKKRLQEFYDLAWDLQLDNLTLLYIVRCNTEKEGFVNLKLSANYDDDTGKIIKFNIGDRKSGWELIKEKAYSAYLKTYKDSIENKETVLSNIKKEMEKRTPFLLNLLKEKPRSRNIPAKVRYEVFQRDGGKCVFCGSNINIEFDHIIPFSKGGSNNTQNIRVLCQECNRRRGNDIEKF